MNNCIVTLNIYDKANLSLEYTKQSMIHYCNAHNIKLVEISERKINKHRVHFEKFQIEDLLSEYYRVLYMDADILITPHALNIFSLFPENSLCAYDESFFGGRPLSPYFNTGVILFPKNSRGLLDGWKDSVDNFVEDGFYEQTFLNMILAKNKNNTDFISLDISWNDMRYKDEIKYKSNFIHYAGFYQWPKERDKTIKEDYEYLYRRKQ